MSLKPQCMWSTEYVTNSTIVRSKRIANLALSYLCLFIAVQFFLPKVVKSLVVIVVAFITLAVISSDFLIPNLQTISHRILGINERLAGMTLLALGNAIPDITSTYQSIDRGYTSLAIGELIGAIFFAMSVILGSMVCVTGIQLRNTSQNFNRAYVDSNDNEGDCDSNITIGEPGNLFIYSRSKFYKDLGLFSIFIMISVLFVLDGSLTFIECCIMLSAYIFYVIVSIYTNTKESKTEKGYALTEETINEAGALLGTEGGIYSVDYADSSLNNKQAKFQVPKLTIISTDEITDLENGLSGSRMVHDIAGNVELDRESLIERENTPESITTTNMQNMQDEVVQEITKREVQDALRVNHGSGLVRISFGEMIGLWDHEELFSPTSSTLEQEIERRSVKSMSNSNYPISREQNNSHESLESANINTDTHLFVGKPPRSDNNYVYNSTRSTNSHSSESLLLSPTRSISTILSHIAMTKQSILIPDSLSFLHIILNAESDYTWTEYFMIVTTLPSLLCCTLLVPVVSLTNDFTQMNWVHIFEIIKVGFAPCLVYFIYSDFQLLLKKFTVLVIPVVLIGAQLKFPKLIKYTSVIGFIVSITVISKLVEIIIDTFSDWTQHISEILLGMTFFVWGNACGDLISNITFMKMSMVDVALGSCFGSPLLYFLCNLSMDGLIILIKKQKHEKHMLANKSIVWQSIKFNVDDKLRVTILGLIIAFTIILLGIPLNKWRLDYKIGSVLISVYAIVTIINIVI